MDTFNRFHHLLSEPKKIAAFSFDENGKVIDNETENQVFLNRSVLTREDVNIDLKQNYESYYPQVDEFKSLFFSNILMELDKRTGRRLKESLMGSDFFTTRGILIALAGGRKQKPFISWGFVIRGVIVLVSDKNLDFNDSSISAYGGMYFENAITYKLRNRNEDFVRSVNNWEQYKEVNFTDIFLTKGKSVRVAYSFQIDAFDEDTMSPLEIKTQYLKKILLKDGKIFGDYKSFFVCLQCMFGNVHEVVVGYKKKNLIVCKIEKHPVKEIL